MAYWGQKKGVLEGDETVGKRKGSRDFTMRLESAAEQSQAQQHKDKAS